MRDKTPKHPPISGWDLRGVEMSAPAAGTPRTDRLRADYEAAAQTAQTILQTEGHFAANLALAFFEQSAELEELRRFAHEASKNAQFAHTLVALRDFLERTAK